MMPQELPMGPLVVDHDAARVAHESPVVDHDAGRVAHGFTGS